MLQRYNNTIKLFLDQTVDPTALKIMLLDDNVAFDATDTSVDAITDTGNYEVHGNGWPQGGEDITSAVVIDETNGAAVTAAPIEVLAVGGNIGPAAHALVYYGDHPLWLETPDTPQTAAEGTKMLVPFASGVLFRVGEYTPEEEEE